MNAKQIRREAILRAEEITVGWLRAETYGQHAATAEQVAIARHVLVDGWRERARERDQLPPQDMAGSCKFATLFFKLAFGGMIEGAYEHQFNVLDGCKFDLSGQDLYADVGFDAEFLGNEEHLDSLRSCLPRVLKWMSRFDGLLSRRKWAPVAMFDGQPLPKRDKGKERDWTEHVQSLFAKRYGALRTALLDSGFSYDASSARYDRDGARVWYVAGTPSIQGALDLLTPYSQFTVKTVKTCHETIRDQLHRSTDEVVRSIIDAVEEQTEVLLEAA
ncbi:hypothetical protein [Burkholderia sp. Ac-20365]|uniref:hypothetical protein n=1 Tax=Burkholderia sp. Ac-20365 TaxID=2703897 RepID=UPI00197C71F8|nr:hypothetical protein [Burkholderia sp. Ac-20365]MBN3760877.1 hypothetical protein [Burkholderia sp. Ac-20365]